MTHTKHPEAIVAAVLFIAAAAVRIAMIHRTGFDGLYGQDPYAYLNAAEHLASGRTPGAFFWPLGYPLALSAALRIGGSTASGQALSVVMGAGLAPLLYLLARQIGLARTSAVFSAVVVMVGGQAIQSSVVLMSDVPASFWAVSSALALAVYYRERQRRWLVMSSLALALAGITRWIYLVLALPWAVSVLVTWRGRLRLGEALAAASAGTAIVAAQLLYSRTSPFPVLDHAWVTGWDWRNAALNTFTNVDGQFIYAQTNAAFYGRVFYDPIYLSPLFTPGVGIGLCSLILLRRFPALVMLAGWLALPYLFLVGIPYQNIRFAFITLPAAALCAAWALEGTQALVRKRLRHPSLTRTLYTAIGTFLVVGLLHMSVVGQRSAHAFIQAQERDKEVVNWAARYLPPGATVYTFGLTLALTHYTGTPVRELYYASPSSLAAEWVPHHDDYLLLNVWEIEHQWPGREPQTAYYWLRDVRGLVRLGRMNNYTFYRIKG